MCNSEQTKLVAWIILRTLGVYLMASTGAQKKHSVSMENAESRAGKVLELREALRMLFDLVGSMPLHGTERIITTKRRLLCASRQVI